MLTPSIVYNHSLIDDIFQSFVRPYRTYTMISPSMKTDMIELEDHYRLEIELPGYDKKDITISYQDGYLNITASKKKEETNQSFSIYLHREIYTDSITRKLFVGDYLKNEDFKASYENGILTLDYPKENESTKEDNVKYISIN